MSDSSEGDIHGYRKTCFDAHGRECVVCGAGENLIAHHVNGNRSDSEVSNLRPMCRSCHRSVHHGSIEKWSCQLPETAIIETHPDGLRPYEFDVLAVLAGGRANPMLIREETDQDKGDVNSVLVKLTRDGLAKRVTTGLYEITDDGREVLDDA